VRAVGPAPRRARAAFFGVLTLAAVAATGCASDASDTAAGEKPAASAAKDLDKLAGRYAHYDVVAYQGDMKTMIISYGFSDFDVVDGGLRTKQTFCFSEARSDQPVKISFSDAATQAIKPPPVLVKVTKQDGRTRIVRPPTPTGIGIRLEDPTNDPLPKDPNDPRIVDDDGDGHPGVTARVEVTPEFIGEIYLARREIFEYDLTPQDDGSMTGHVNDNSEQLIIGASDPIFVQGGEWTQHPDRAKSPIILKPVPRSWDCARLRAERPTLFPPTPSVDY
jgi:hypothetical protein